MRRTKKVQVLRQKAVPTSKENKFRVHDAAEDDNISNFNQNVTQDGSPSKHNEEDMNDDDDDDDDDDEEDSNFDIKEALEEDNEVPSSQRKRKFPEEPENGMHDGQKKKRKNKASTDLTKPPTAHEMAQLRETENLFHSNLFRLQISEMLNELKVKSKREKQFSDWFTSVKESLGQMSDGKEYELMDQKWIKKLRVCIPLVLNPNSVKGVYRFLPPSSINIIGSYAVGCNLGPKMNIDISVEMPRKCFQSGDYMNQGYLRKRSMYLCHIVSHLISKNLVVGDSHRGPRFVLTRAGNPLLPVAEVVPSGVLEGHAVVHLHINAPEDTFKLSKLGPSKNSVRPSWFFIEKQPEEEKGPATPLHNASILGDLVSKSNEALKAETLGDSENLKEGIKLLKVWLRQRQLDKGFAAFGSYLMSMIVVHLARTRRVSSQMSSYQIARVVWTFLRDSAWTEDGKGCTMCEKPPAGAPSLKEFHDNYEVVFVDSTGYCNLAAHMNVTSYEQIKTASSQALQCLDNPSINGFQTLFMTPSPFYRQFDHIIVFHNLKDLDQMSTKVSSAEQKLDATHHKVYLAVYHLLSVLQKGLGKRVCQWGVQVPNQCSWKVGDQVPESSQGPILVGINLDSEHAYSILDKGPPADSPEAEEFRTFWGKKSDLRRFQDGSISEAVVWHTGNSATLSQRRLICRTIVEYVLGEKLGLDLGSNINYMADQIEDVLHLPHIKPAGFTYGTGEEATLAVLSAMNKLSADLRGLSDLPLDISGIQGSCPVFRYADVFPPLSTTHNPSKKTTFSGDKSIMLRTGSNTSVSPQWLAPIEVIVQLGISGKWPDDAEAVRRVRAAFNLKISECLGQQYGLTAQAHPNFVDVLKEGFVFRMIVAYQREAGLLRRVLTTDGMTKYVECEEAMKLEKETVLIPRITSYLHGLHQQRPAFGPTACLVKRWISAHLFRSSHFPELAVELLVARLFLNTEPFSPSAQPQTAFLRFLYFLSSTNWHVEPVILNFNDEMTRDDISEIEKQFMANRGQLPPLFIATPVENERSVFTKEAPSLTILLRTALLASESLKLLESQYLTPLPSTSRMWKHIFQPSLEPFNVIIRLHSLMVPRRAQSVDAQERNWEPLQLEPYKKLTNEKIPVVGVDPVQCYLKELEENYGHFALFFHDVFGGSVIGVVWKPALLEKKEFKVSHVNGCCLDPAQNKTPSLVLNKDAIVEDFYILGTGIVNTIEVQN